MKFFFLVVFILNTLYLDAQKISQFKDDFAIVNKTFSRDFEVSLRLYISYEKFVQEKIPFYIIAPQDEIEKVKNLFSNALLDRWISSLPTFMTDEQVFKSCGKNILKKSLVKNIPSQAPGWRSQQIIKFCFYSTNLAKNYFTTDSDNYFTKPFSIKTLFSENGEIKTFHPIYLQKNNAIAFEKKWNQDQMRASTLKNIFKNENHTMYENFKEIKKIIGDDLNTYNNYVVTHATWSSEILKNMNKFISQQEYDFADLIYISPWEMQWYATYILVHHKDKFYPINPLFTLIYNNGKKQCFPENGLSQHYGIGYQHYSTTSEKYYNECSKIRTILNVKLQKMRDYFRYLKGYYA